MKKTVKFGGSSLADAKQFRKVAAIIQADPQRRYVVVSAPGKRNSADVKITDLLYQCYDLAASGQSFAEPFALIRNRYLEIVQELELSLDLQPALDEIEQFLTATPNRDFAASRGEYLNGLIMAAYLDVPFLDPAQYILFRVDGSFDAESTNSLFGAALEQHPRAVIPGFYGRMPDGTIRTFSRGGSDITGAIVARASQSDVYENWTDVSGMLIADPRIVDHPKPISVITYLELRELSYMGASVMHEEAVFPVKTAGIPINIRNTNDPDAAGTMIVPSCPTDKADSITGIAGRKGFSVLTITKDLMNSEIGFGYRVLEVLKKYNLSFEHMPSGIDTMSLVISTAQLAAANRTQIVHELCAVTKSDTIILEDGVALIAVVGRGMVAQKGTAARLFTAIAEADINVRMIDQGSSEYNIILGIAGEDYEKAIRAIYHAFCE